MDIQNVKLLIIEDDVAEAVYIQSLLRTQTSPIATFETKHCLTLKLAFEYLEEHQPDLILLDLNLGPTQGIETFQQLNSHVTDIPIIILTALNENLAHELLRAGAQDYLFKTQLDPNLLPRTILYCIERHQWHKQRQSLELQAQQERMKALMEFISHTSHDFKTPLSVIRTNAYIWGRKSGNPELETYQTVIEEQVDHLSKLVDAMHMIVRLDTQAELDLQPVALNDMIEQTMQEYRSLIEAKGLSVEIALDKKDEVLASLDPQIFPYVLNILIENAIQYTEQGNISIQSKFENDSINIHIKDTGIGIDSENLPHIFERFYKVDKARTNSTTTGGLGLAIAQKIVDSHNGTLLVESVLDEGTTFSVHIPLTNDGHTSVEQQATPGSG